MDGLECCEIKRSRLGDENPNYRIDSNFFDKQVLRALAMVRNRKHYYLKPQNIVNGPFGSTITSEAHLEKGFIPLIRSININRGFFIDNKDLVYISKEDNDVIQHSQLMKDDIVLSRVGSIGYFARVDAGIGTSNISSNNIGIKLGNFPEYERHYILTYLNTKCAYMLTNRRASGNVQPKLTVEEICRIPIPAFSERFYRSISGLILDSEQLRDRSCALYGSAEAAVVSALGITDADLPKRSISHKSLSESFGVSGRLDAEYYQPKYDELFARLDGFATWPLGGDDGLVYMRKSIEPGSEFYQEEGIPFVRVSDVDKFEMTAPSIKLPRKIVPNVESLYPKKDTILFSKDGSVGIAYKVEENMEVITSGALLHLKIKDTSVILPDYLTLILNSPIVQMQAERDANGAIIQHWKPSDIEKVIIPVLDMDAQRSIADKVQQSFRLRNASKRLLELATSTVEMAIEMDEEAALSWLEMQKNIV